LLEWLPAKTELNHPFCKTMQKVLAELGQPTKMTMAPYSTNMGYVTARGIPSILYGPGSITQAHIANEYCPIDDILNSTKVLALLTIDLLGVA
jgi:acetylornithine deacetylase/succinyl-diaminopimelate desuccinylase-like protein